MCKNIDLFDEYVALIFGRLYERFPLKTRIEVAQLTGHGDIDDFGRLLAPDGRPSVEADIAYATLEWLQESGFIQCRHPNPPYAFDDSILTAKGLEVLKGTPKSVQTKETIGDKIVTTLRTGSKDLAREAAKTAIAAGAHLLLRP